MSNDVRGRFVWHELLTTDTAAAAAFYAHVVPWRSLPSSMPGYTVFMSGQSQVAGLMALPQEPSSAPAHWLMYLGTPDVDATCAQAQALGARLCKAPGDIPNVGRFAVLADPQGATFAVFTPGSMMLPAVPPFGSFTWHELATTDVAGALRFYGELFGWAKGVGHDMGAMGIYQLFEHSGATVGGMCSTQGPSTPPSWLSYVHVADSGRAVGAAKAAGGRLLHGPVEVPDGSWIALFLDPQGGAFAVHEMQRAVSPAATPGAASTVLDAPAKAAVAPTARPAAARKKAASKMPPAKKRPAKRAATRKKAVKKVPRKKSTAKVVKKSARRAKKTVRRTVRRAARKK